MPERSDPSDDLLARLRAEADRLDAAAPAITASAAVSASPAAPPGRRWLPAAAVIVVVAGLGAAWLLLSGDGDHEQLIVPADPPASTTTTTTFVPPFVDIDVPRGIAITSSDGTVRLLDLEGAEIGTVSAPVEAIEGPELMLTEPPTPVEPIDPADVPDGCSSAFGGGGVRVALCGDTAELPRTINVVAPDGSARRLTGPPFDDSEDGSAGAGHWNWALPSPDGRWVLAQWTNGCGAPVAYLTLADGEGVPLDLAPVPAFQMSRGLGWTDDGRALLELGPSACGGMDADSGVYSLDPESRDLTLLVGFDDRSQRAYLWREPDAMSPIGRLLTRAQQELDLQYVLGPDDVPVASFEGHLIDVNGNAEPGPPDPAGQPMDVLHGQATLSRPGLVEGATASLSFTCGGIEWRLDWRDEGSPEVDSMLLLAEALVPHLYCTLPPR